jgi:hypothetical protein
VVGVVDVGWCGAVGPGQASGVGDGGLPVALADGGVVGWTGEEQQVGVGGAAGGPVGAVVDLAVIARRQAVGSGAAAVAGITDDALVGGGDALLAAQVDGSIAVVVEHRQVVNTVGGHPDQIAHRQRGVPAGARR